MGPIAGVFLVDLMNLTVGPHLTQPEFWSVNGKMAPGANYLEGEGSFRALPIDQHPL